LSQTFPKVAVKIQGKLVVAEVGGCKAIVGLELDQPHKVIENIEKRLKRQGKELSFEEEKVLHSLFYEELEKYVQSSAGEEEVEEERKPLFVFHGEKGTEVKILESDGIRLDVASLAYAGEHEIVVGELSYAYGLLKKVDEDGKPFEVETVEPVVAIAKYRDGALVERSINSPRFLKTLDIEERKALVMMKTRAVTPLETLPDVKILKEFIEGASAPTFPELYREAKEEMSKWLDFSFEPAYYAIGVCWIMGTYFADLLWAFPFTYFYAPTGFGKSRGCITFTYMSRHGFQVTDPSSASFYRINEAYKPTLGIDEAVVGGHFWKLLRTAYKRGFKVPRMEKGSREEFILALYETYAPVVFAATELPTELGGGEADISRTIFFYMKQRPDPAKREPTPHDFKAWREKMYLARLCRASEFLKALKETDVHEIEYNGAKVTLKGHLRESWRPILAIASLCGQEVLETVKAYIVKTYAKQEEEIYKLERVCLGGLWDLFTKEKKVEVTFQAKQLQQNIINYEEVLSEDEIKSVKKEWSPEKIGRLLHRMGVKHKLMQGKTLYSISLKEAFDFSQTYQFFTSKQEALNMLKTLIKLKEEDKEKEQHEAFYHELEELKAAALREEEQSTLRVEYYTVINTPPSTPPNTSGGVGGALFNNMGVENDAKNFPPPILKTPHLTPPTPPETVGWSMEKAGLDTPPTPPKCGSCAMWSANKCTLHPEWTVVTPDHPACEHFKPREGGG
jgi:hypothetical protein